ncbi:DUF481 domain-containing protein [Croceicoccus mobilis]|uniref:Salt-induced outer membrane protein n=1 Tax=Croceicoccus mobilis TaxID=1703339 RepID=A0A917DTT2_9SPHN|nr:DUF481 domain-containing protein [Croceicoccus mobilis]GGD66438.1 hypothetical protein GCM10010990_14980 [Croceicoccus mobilis]
MGSKTALIGLLATAAATPAMAQTATVIDPYPRQAPPPPPLTGLPDPVREMVETAIATGDADKVKTVIEIARRTYPDGGAELDKLETGFKANRQRIAAAEAARKREALRTAGPFEGWSGKGEFGALASTGNSEDVGVTAGFKASRVGINWRHAVRLSFDYQRSDGDTTRERYLAAYEPNINISKSAFVYGLGQFERDKVQGFLARYSASSGVGYRFFDREDLKLSAKIGPAWRRTELVDPMTADENDTYFAGLGGLEFEWRFADNWSLTESATAFVSDNSTYTSLTGVQAGIGKRLKARLSYSIEHDTDPPEDTKPTDTLSRISLIYDF